MPSSRRYAHVLNFIIQHIMDSLPTLDQLLESKTCFVLGAGASADFGLPLWADLRYLLQEKIQKSDDRSEMRKYWVGTLKNATDSVTIDELAMEARNDQEFNYLQRNLSEIILQGEAELHDKDNWVSIFARAVGQKMMDFEDKALLFASNISVVSLNYDRCFNHYFAAGIKESVSLKYKRPRLTQGHYEVIENEIENIIHPHGCIGQLNSKKFIQSRLDNTLQRIKSYDTVVEFGGSLKVKQTPPIFPIDEIRLPRFSKNPAYVKANVVINTSTNCICIGVSPFGLKQSLLSFSNAKKVFYTGNEKIHPNFIPMGMRAKPLIEKILSS